MQEAVDSGRLHIHVAEKLEKTMRTLKAEELLIVAGGLGDPVPEPEPAPEKGNNGWGNGAEGINNGSDEGGTADSKLPEAGEHKNHTQR